MTDVILHEKYVSQQENILKLFLNTKDNLFLKKGSTGIGGTESILNATDTNRIVVSPTVGMIQGKEQQHKHKRNLFFIYGGSDDTWIDYIKYNSQKTLNTTPDQIVKIFNNKMIFDEIKHYTIFIDEIHQYIPDSGYRNCMADFMSIIYNDWIGNKILSSATDNLICGELLDIEPTQVFTHYNIIKPNQSIKEIEVYRSGERIGVEHYIKVAEESIMSGRKLIIATNRTDIHKSFAKIEGYKNRILNLVGDVLETKLRVIKDRDENYDIDEKDIILISAKYFAGYDIELDCDILIDASPYNKSSLISVGDMKQIIGRARKGVGRIVLFISYNQPRYENNLHTPIILGASAGDIQRNIIKELNDITKENWFQKSEQIIKDYSYWCLLYKQLLDIEFSRYNLKEVPYKQTSLTGVLKVNSQPFHLQLETLVEIIDLQTLKYDFSKIVKLLKNHDEGSFSPEIAPLFYIAIKIKEGKIQKPNFNKNLKPTLYYPSLNKYLKDDWRWSCIYTYLKCKWLKSNVKKLPNHAKFSKESLDYLEIRSLPTQDIIETSTGYKEAMDKSKEHLSKLNITLSIEEEFKLNERCISVFKRGEQYKTKRQLIDLISRASMYILNGGVENYFYEYKDDRQFNPLTQIPKPLRNMLGVELIEIDIKQANARFVDIMVDSNLADFVYQRVMALFNVSREEAKVKYNSMLNNSREDPEIIYDFFKNIGYTHDQAMKLIHIIKGGVGDFYRKSTKQERLIIESIVNNYISEKTTRWFRFHDALLLLKNENGDIKTWLPDVIQPYNIKLNIKMYNTGLDY
jgi:hypothetical protein